jgi:hypothetical protein
VGRPGGKQRDHLGDLGVYGRIILKNIERALTAFSYFIIGTNNGLL